MTTIVHHGLEGIIAAETRVSMVDGEAGELLIAGRAVEELAPTTSFEETLALLWNRSDDPSDLRRELARRRVLEPRTLRLLEQAAADGVGPMDALRMAAGTLDAADDRQAALELVAKFPVIVATSWRMRRDLAPAQPSEELAHVANYLFMLEGSAPDPVRARALETYLITVSDHGLNASTFTARVIASTQSDFVSAVTGAVGALKGPLHGGAPGPALEMVFEIAQPARAEEVLRRRISAGERLMGFGHRVYKVRDPRADVLAAAAAAMFAASGDRALYELALHVESVALRLLEEHKPGRRLQTNVEFYTALLLHGLGMEVPLFTPTFAIGRVAGWTAHCFEQRAVGKLIRPQSLYVGPRPPISAAAPAACAD